MWAIWSVLYVQALISLYGSKCFNIPGFSQQKYCSNCLFRTYHIVSEEYILIAYSIVFTFYILEISLNAEELEGHCCVVQL